MKPIILNPNEIDYSVIDQMFSAMLSQNESKATIDALRPKVEAAVKELIRQRGLPKDFTGTIEYNGIKIVVRRPTSYTWEQNTHIKDINLDMYKARRSPAAVSAAVFSSRRYSAAFSLFVGCSGRQPRVNRSPATRMAECSAGSTRQKKKRTKKRK